MSETLINRLTKTHEGLRLYQQERAILDATELVCEKMNKLGISRDDLAEGLGRSVKYVDKLLDGRKKITVRKLSDIFVALGFAVHFSAVPLAQTSEEQSPSSGSWRFATSIVTTPLRNKRHEAHS